MSTLLQTIVPYIQSLLTQEDGQDLIEYALIIVVILFVAVLGMTTLGGQISGVFEAISSWLSGYPAP